MGQITEQFVDSSDGVRIAVYEEGNPDGPTVVLVHGWPDSHVLWDGVVPLLADRFRIVRYDNRGVGKSSVPKPVSAYTMACFADDFAAVIDAVAPGEPVHVLAHDWGSAADLGVPVPARRQRPRRVVHVGVRPERRSHEPLRLRQPQTAVPSAAVRAERSTSCCGCPTWACSRSPCSRRCSCAPSLPMGSGAR